MNFLNKEVIKVNIIEKITIAMTLSPRVKETYNMTISSIRAAGFYDNIIIFSEPGQYLFDDNNLTLIGNKEKLGCFKNYNNALNYLIVNTDKELIFTIQDDHIFRNDIFNKLNSILSFNFEEVGYFSPLLFTRMFEKIGLKSSENEGWKESSIGWGSWGACYIMPINSVKKMLQHPFYINHLNNYKKNEQIDACVSETFKQLPLKMFFHMPSLVEHIGDHSTLKHDNAYDKTRGFGFYE